jgi:hypothetical protein
MCAIASFVLRDILVEYGYSAEVIHGYYKKTFNEHCWVRYKNYNIDITATQFDRTEDVYITSECNSSYVEMLTYKDYKEFKAWPKEQRPSKRVVNIIKEML